MSLRISFEVFPPKTATGLDHLRSTVKHLRRADPIYVSVTYGAGGSEHHFSYDAIRAVASTGVPVAGHLTCVGQSVDALNLVLNEYQALGVHQVVALRGDPPDGIDAPYTPHPRGYQRTADLVAAIAARGRCDISVSAYPEKHPQSPSFDHDLEVLARKVNAGASRAMTQMFFDNEVFARYLDLVNTRQIEVKVVPGIFPIHCFETVSRFAARCGATIPARVAERFEGASPADAREIAADLAAEQIDDLRRYGVDHVHLYTINQSDLALGVCERLGILTPRPTTPGRS